MKFVSKRFGEIGYKEEEIIKVIKGIVGFPHLTQYVVIQQEEGSSFRWLQSIEDPAVAFVVANPLDFFPRYHIKINPSETEELKFDKTGDLLTLTIVTVPQNNPAEMSANLLGPVLVNSSKKLAKQVVLANSPYTTKHYIIEMINGAPKPQEERMEPQTVQVG